MFLLLATGLLCLVGAGLAVGRVAFASTRDRHEALVRATAYGRATTRRKPSISLAHVLRLGVSLLARIAVKVNPKASEERVRVRLHNAGLAHRVSPEAFLATQVLLGAFFAFAGFTLSSKPVGQIFLALVFGAGAVYLSEFYLSRRATRRGEIIAGSLPRIIDQLTISMEAGLSFDASLSHVTARGEGPLIEEFRIMLGEMKVGETRVRALKRLAERVPGPEINGLVQAVVQSEQQGISLASILRGQAGDLRHRRQMLAEEKAMKAPVKMLFPIVIFILPVMFVVIIGPAFIHSGGGFLGN
jgi:tight adherence protein C